MTKDQAQTTQTQKFLAQAFQDLKIAKKDSHKGENGKLLIIGGSQLFHAASKWSLDIASKIVDMVFYSSVPSNNNLIRQWQKGELAQQLNQQAKANFWQGIVIDRNEIEAYLEEADCILLGPGMERSTDTNRLSNRLLRNWPEKKWVIDAGALQMINPDLLNANCIITPHQQEIKILQEKNSNFDPQNYQAPPTCLLKGQIDQIFSRVNNSSVVIEVKGGNAGMTKGGTGDVLAGLLAALYCKNQSLTSSLIASYINKKAGDDLHKKVGPYFNSSDLVDKIPQVLWQEIQDQT